ncbi:MAG TPA: hypothetical protein VK465_04780 [Fibrobacteria bacterium]|nr:hypothetical protein [Fibrobacteria bacterium]
MASPRGPLQGRFLLLILFALLMPGCNVWRDTAGIEPESANEHILEGQILLRKARYSEAQTEFETAIRKDSSKSEAYYGAAKCTLLVHKINMFKLVQSFQENNGASIPFLGEPDSVKDVIYVANRGINHFLGLLSERDLAGRSDGKVSARRYSGDYAISSAIAAVLSIADFNADGRIDARDNLLSGIIDFTDPAKLNPDSIMANLADLKNDTAKIAALNNLLEKSEDLLSRSTQAIDLFLGTAGDKMDTSRCPPGDTACVNAAKQLSGGTKEKVDDSAVTQVKKFIQDAGSTVVIYKVFDGIDNDGDGCVDEEVLDGIDNDGDGRADEDSRGAPESGNARFLADQDGVDNDLDGETDEADEKSFHDRYQATLAPLELAARPERRGRIFWNDTADTREKVLVVLDSLASPPAVDTVGTFDLCNRSKAQGFRKAR